MPGEAKRRHRRGEGSTYPDGDRWIAALSLGRDRKTGKRRVIRRVARDGKDAEAKLAGLRRWYGKAGDVAFQTLDDYLADWLDTVKLSVSPSTFVSYSGHVEHHIGPFLGGIHVGELRPADVQRLIRDRIAAGKSPATVQRIVTTLRIALNEAIRDGELTVNVASRVRLPRVERHEVEAMTDARAEAILQAFTGHHLKALVTLLLGTGMRVGEAVALDWKDVDLDGATVFVRRGKTPKSRRTIPLAPFVVRALREQRAKSPRVGPDEPVFLGQRRTPRSHAVERVDTRTVTHTIPRVIEKAGLGKMRTHDLRHATATLLIARGVPMQAISEILGHASPSMTADVYAHVTVDTKRRAILTLDDLAVGGE